MKISLFKRHLLITVIVTLGFVFVGLFGVHLFMEYERQKLEVERREFTPPLFFANLVDQLVEINGYSPEQAVEQLRQANRNDSLPMEIQLVAREAYAKEKNIAIEQLPAPGAAMSSPARGPGPGEPGGPGPGPGPAFGGMGPGPGGPPGPGRGPGGPPPEVAIGLKSAKDHLLVVKPLPLHKGRMNPPPSFARFFTMNIIALCLAVLLASAASLFILFYSMREKARLAGAVIEDMKRGNLKARFPVKKVDEVSQLMVEFNKMADEIESLVRRIKESEQGRMALLQQLAHDLRTPVASLKNLLETLVERGAQIQPDVRAELMSLSLKEVDYFERLVEDLLFLAQVSEPKYNSKAAKISLSELVDDEIDTVLTRHSSGENPVRIVREDLIDDAMIEADPHLLRRLIRNALENAVSFAKTQVSVKLEFERDLVKVLVRDDGPGLPEDALAAFGEKRFSRILSKDAQGRLSVGLGSVIMKAVAQIYGGQVSIRNVLSSSSRIEGAELSVTLRSA